MWQYVAKVALTALLVVAVSELGKRNSFWAAALAALPFTSILAFVWLYLDTGDTERVALLSRSIFWLVIPSLPLFLILTGLLRSGFEFWSSLVAACAGAAVSYLLTLRLLGMLGVRL